MNARPPQVQGRATEGDASMKCPVCNDVDLTMSERQGVEIDYCPRCRGVWLDRGELDKIIERSDRDDDDGGDRRRDDDRYRGAPPPQQHGGGYGKPHKKKSFWHELFD
jgi:uncharacterized protein